MMDLLQKVLLMERLPEPLLVVLPVILKLMELIIHSLAKAIQPDQFQAKEQVVL